MHNFGECSESLRSTKTPHPFGLAKAPLKASNWRTACSRSIAMSTNPSTSRLSFPGHSGELLAARLDVPAGRVRAWALFAHCFTCSKDLLAAKRIAVELARAGIAVLRFDFTGLGSSEGEFASTNFSSNLKDLVIAADYLRDNHEAPSLLIGHSLGGAAVLAAAAEIPEVQAVATVGAPADVDHVLAQFEANLEEIEQLGVANVSLAGRAFTIERQFVEDLRSFTLTERVSALRKPLLVLHSPVDLTVDVEHATRLFVAAKHPKSFVSLDQADHLLSKGADADYVARVIVGWADRYLPPLLEPKLDSVQHVRVSETGAGKFQQIVRAGKHRLYADEPTSFGGTDTGLAPYDFVAAALGACTSMTLRMYAEHKKLTLGNIAVEVSHEKIHAKDCAECSEERKDSAARVDRFTRVVSIQGDVPEALSAKLLAIADRCPVHQTLERSSVIATTLEGS